MITPEEMASFALQGHPDDVRTMLGLIVCIGGMVGQVENFVGGPRDTSRPELLTMVARSWDGLDNERDVEILRAALEVLHHRVEALL